MSPGRWRRAVVVLQQRFGGIPTPGVRGGRPAPLGPAPRTRQPSDMESMLRARLREISRAHPRWGWPKVYWLLPGEGHQVNRKRICRYRDARRMVVSARRVPDRNQTRT